jgi:branched-chain amino acid transport system substrate-binding protein
VRSSGPSRDPFPLALYAAFLASFRDSCATWGFSRRFQEKYNRIPDHNAYKGYIGVHMLKAAVQRVGAWDQARVRACLHNNLFTAAEEPGVLMDVYVNDKGSVDRESFIVEVRGQKSVVAKTVPMLRGPYKERSCK